MPGVCPRCLREVYFAEEKLALGKVWHTFCFSCRNCRKLLDSCTVATHCGELFCRNCCTRLFTPTAQSPSPPPPSNLIVEDRGPPFPTGRAPVSACDSVSDCYCCCCHPEDYSTCEVRPETATPREKQRLRGGGGEEEEEEPEELRIGEETRQCSESDCSNLGVVSSVTTLCNAPSSPTAVTTWYNRQHSASQSTFGGQVSTKRRSGRPSSTPSPGTAASNFRSNTSDCLNSGSNCGNGRHKCVNSGARRSASPCRIQRIQHGQNQEQQLKHLPQAQQLQLQLNQQQHRLQPQLPLQQSLQQKQPLKHQHQQQHQHQQSQQKLNREQIQQELKNLNLNPHNKNNCHKTSLRYLRTSKSEKRISRGTAEQAIRVTSYETESGICANINYLRKKLARQSSPRRRVSFCSDVPEEANSFISETSSGRMKMPNGNNNHFHGNLSSSSGTTSTSNNPDNYTSSNGTPYETCYEMEDSNSPNSAPSCNCSPGTSGDYERQFASYDDEEDSRLRGGCGGGGGGRSGGCGSGNGGCGGCQPCPPPSCPPRDECREMMNTCPPPSRCCSPAGCRPVCRKPTRSCCPPCTSEPQGCGGGGCCGGGCRGGCGKPGRPCMPSRPCSTPPCQQTQSCRPRGSPCMPPRCSAPTPPCCKPPGVKFRPHNCGVSGAGGGGSCCRSKSPRRGCCSSPQDDGCSGYCGPKLPPGCECLGGGLDCQRCGRKVYQAEMQIASGVPYHNICFSCFCCRKPLEPLTYQENCGEIYCKQCYVRNFGPQGYGYGAGAGALQTPL